MLEGVLESDLKYNKIMVLAATESFDLNETLFTSRGKHYFKSVYNTTDLNRVKLLSNGNDAQFYENNFRI